MSPLYGVPRNPELMGPNRHSSGDATGNGFSDRGMIETSAKEISDPYHDNSRDE